MILQRFLLAQLHILPVDAENRKGFPKKSGNGGYWPDESGIVSSLTGNKKKTSGSFESSSENTNLTEFNHNVHHFSPHFHDMFTTFSPQCSPQCSPYFTTFHLSFHGSNTNFTVKTPPPKSPSVQRDGASLQELTEKLDKDRGITGAAEGWDSGSE